MIEQPCQLGTVAARARELLFVNPAAAGLGERGALKAEVLVVGRNPRVAERITTTWSQMSSQNFILLR
jgi:hypothetical protein